MKKMLFLMFVIVASCTKEDLHTTSETIYVYDVNPGTGTTYSYRYKFLGGAMHVITPDGQPKEVRWAGIAFSNNVLELHKEHYIPFEYTDSIVWP